MLRQGLGLTGLSIKSVVQVLETEYTLPEDDCGSDFARSNPNAM